MVNMFLEQAPWFPAEGKEAVNGWLKICKKGCEAFKMSINESYKKVEDFLVNIEEKTGTAGRRSTEKTNVNLRYLEKPVYSTPTR